MTDPTPRIVILAPTERAGEDFRRKWTDRLDLAEATVLTPDTPARLRGRIVHAVLVIPGAAMHERFPEAAALLRIALRKSGQPGKLRFWNGVPGVLWIEA